MHALSTSFVPAGHMATVEVKKLPIEDEQHVTSAP
jgi:hypothetical protein